MWERLARVQARSLPTGAPLSHDQSIPMKPLLCPLMGALLCALPLAAPAQQSTTEVTTTTTQPVAPATDAALPEVLFMSSGTVVLKRGNATSQLQAPVKLTDGSMLTPGGTVTRPDGTRNQLIDGQTITSAGVIGVAPQATGAESSAVDKTNVPKVH